MPLLKNGTIKVTTGRRTLLLFILAGFFMSILILLGFERFLLLDNVLISTNKIIDYYLPMISLLLGCYLSEIGSSSHSDSTTLIETYFITIAIAGIWIFLLPIMLLKIFYINPLIMHDNTIPLLTIENLWEIIDKYRYLSGTVMMAIGFYFSKD